MKSQRMVEVGEAVLESVIYGSGDTVILLPGGGCGVSYFDPFAQTLAAAGFRAVAVNPRGVSESTGSLEGLTLHHLAADIAGVIEAFADASVHVLGHAFGNRIARCLAVDHPDLVRSVILLAAGGLVGPDPETHAPVQRLLRQGISEAERLELMKAVYLSPASDPRVLLQLEQWPDVTAAQMAASQATPLDDWWEGGTAPLLVVQGLDDRRAPPGNGRALRDQMGARVRLVEIPQAGHLALLEQPQAVADAVIAFLREH